jgi:ribose transport system substrate-binding protein
MAEYVVARSQLEGTEAPKTVVIENKDQAGHKAGFETFNASMGELCPECDVVDEEFAISQVPNPAAANWKSQILANPDANAVVFDTISWVPAGLGAAIKASPNKELLTCCADATNEEGLALIREGTISASLSWPIEYDAWSIADTTNQVLAGVDPSKLPPEGGGFQIVDADHNLPESGGLPYPIDFREIRTKAWNAG